MSYDNELYQQVILDHNRNPKNFREIKNATHSCHGINPLCGDDMTVYMEVDSEQGVIQDISFVGTGCAVQVVVTVMTGRSTSGMSCTRT